MSIEERIARLENENRRWRWATIGLAFALVLLASSSCDERSKTNSPDLSSANPPDVMRTRCLEILDAKGQKSLVLGDVADEGSRHPVLVIGGKGKGSVGVTVDEDGASILLMDTSGEERAYISAGKEGGQFAIHNHKSDPLVRIIETKEGGSVSVFDSEGRPSGGLVGTNAGGGLALLDKGRPKVMLSVNAGGGGAIEVCNGAGISVGKLLCDKKNCGMVAVCDFDGQPKNGLTVGK
jgi:hypothetical protein